MRIKLALVLGIAGVLLFSCTSFPEPKPGRDTLVIAKLSYLASGLPWNFANGTKTSDVKLWMYHLGSKKVFSGVSRASGLVAFTNIPDGQYTLVQMSIKILDSSATYTSGYEIKGPGYTFAVESGKVTNLGHVAWSETYTKFEGGRATSGGVSSQVSTIGQVNVGAGYGEVLEAFQKANSKSKWNDQLWVDAEYR